MPTTIEALAVRRHGRRLLAHPHVLVERAAAEALHDAGLVPADVGLLINVGLYHHHNLGEPAYAAILQEDIGANPEDPHPGAHGTFSFDIANGTCGPLTALEIADGFLASGAVDHVLVVAGDVHPGAHQAPGFPFAPAGAAMVLGRDGGTARWELVGTAWERSDDPDLLSATVHFDGHRNVLEVVEDPEFAGRAAVVATKAVGSLLADHGVRPDEVGLVVAAPARPAFADGLNVGLDVEADAIVMSKESPAAHTASVLAAMEEHLRPSAVDGARYVLLVTAGAGITAGAALLRRRDRRS